MVAYAKIDLHRVRLFVWPAYKNLFSQMGLFSSRMKGSLFLQTGQLSGLYTKIFTLLHRFFFHPTSLFSISLTSIFSAPLSLRFPFIFNPLFSLSLLCLFLSSPLSGRCTACGRWPAQRRRQRGGGRDSVSRRWPGLVGRHQGSVLLDPTDMILFRLNFFVFFSFFMNLVIFGSNFIQKLI